MEPKPTSEGRKRFTVKMQNEDIPLVKPLFKATAAAAAASAKPTPESAAMPSGESYADYIVGHVMTSAVQKKTATSVTEAAAAAATTTKTPSLPAGKFGSVVAVPRGMEDKGLPLKSASQLGSKQTCIIVSPRQRGNPILKFIRNVPWEFGEIVPDYLLGQSTCALFLSLRYHNLNPNYIHERLQNLGKTYQLHVLLLHVDVKDPHQALKELAQICILADCTLLLAWSPEEGGRYLETYKAYEQKPADLLKEKVEQDYLSRMTDCLTSVKSVNKTDTLSLLSTFGSLASIVQASKEDLALCPGIGPQKAKRLIEVLHEPFLQVPKREEERGPQGSMAVPAVGPATMSPT